MRKTYFPLILISCLVCSLSVDGQTFSLSGELRPRTEYRHGFSTLIDPGDRAAFFVSQRSRLNFDWQNQDLTFYISFQDVRVWGEVPQLNRSDINSSIHEAWGEIAVSEALSLRLGRQELVYDNARILGNVDWAQQGRSHDMALLKWATGENSRLHAGFAFNQERERLFFTYYNLANYKTMQFVWFNTSIDNLDLSLLFLNNGIQYLPARTVFSQTTGGRVTHTADDLNLAGSLYFQTGRDGSNRTLKAWYLAAQGGFPIDEQLTAAAGFELLSGNDLTDIPPATTNNAFTPLYGTNHAFNGHMDYFYVGNHINNVGLINPYLTAAATSNQWSFTGFLHLFFAYGTVHQMNNPDQAMSPYLGTEVDLIAGYTINQQASVRLGYSQMFGSQTLERIRAGSSSEINNWAWVMVIIKPTLLSL